MPYRLVKTYRFLFFQLSIKKTVAERPYIGPPKLSPDPTNTQLVDYNPLRSPPPGAICLISLEEARMIYGAQAWMKAWEAGDGGGVELVDEGGSMDSGNADGETEEQGDEELDEDAEVIKRRRRSVWNLDG